MKKILFAFTFAFFLGTSSVQAKSIKVTAVENFKSTQPSQTFTVQTIESKEISKNIFIPANTTFSGFIVNVEEPKRGKRNSYIEFVPTSLTYEGKTTKLNHPTITAKITGYTPIDPKSATVDVSLKVANFLLKGLISACQFVQGAATAQNGTRIKSGAMNVYKHSFLSYIEVGDELNVKKGDILTFKIKINKKTN